MFKTYRRKGFTEARRYTKGEDLTGVSIDQTDKDAGSPKEGDMIARNPANHADQWLINAAYFAANYEETILSA
jgi:hypothetical protein